MITESSFRVHHNFIWKGTNKNLESLKNNQLFISMKCFFVFFFWDSKVFVSRVAWNVGENKRKKKKKITNKKRKRWLRGAAASQLDSLALLFLSLSVLSVRRSSYFVTDSHNGHDSSSCSLLLFQRRRRKRPFKDERWDPFFQLLMAFCHKDTVEKKDEKEKSVCISFGSLSLILFSDVFFFSFWLFRFPARIWPSLFGDFPTHPTLIFNQGKLGMALFACYIVGGSQIVKKKIKIK